MPKHLFTLLLLLPALAWADCGFSRSGNTMTIVVAKNGERCLSSDGFRTAFKSDVAEALDDGDARAAVAAQKKAIDERSSSGRKLWTIAEGRYQASVASGRYFGQKR